ncbi:hypothetical protein A2U01_0100040, partial [Trifolium medium]|nr:hypothetical protein [Trifolium medium]
MTPSRNAKSVERTLKRQTFRLLSPRAWASEGA